ncbi:MAG: 30S ribosomal protein S17 [Mycoplasmataceae bacterium]|nr:30S ribosomal protein S17 [Mycoplasmataceae bacterium]
MERTTSRKTYKGKVVSAAADKTITVQIDTYRAHKLYGKRVKYSKKFLVHDENNSAKIGDIVAIAQTRPYSKRKTFRLVEIKETK